MDHGTHVIVDGDEFIDAGAAADSPCQARCWGGRAAWASPRGSRLRRAGARNPRPEWFARFGLRTRTRRWASTPIKLDDSREGLDSHVAQTSDGAHRRVRVQRR